MLGQIEDFEPELVVIDPISAFGSDSLDRQALFTRLIDHLKTRGTTAVCTSLVGATSELSGPGLSSIIDTWVMLMATERAGERHRALTVIKSRGMAHSHQVREMSITDTGIDLGDVYTGQSGAARAAAWVAGR
jgi:circadian clock protein KaiC